MSSCLVKHNVELLHAAALVVSEYDQLGATGIAIPWTMQISIITANAH
jgi:hypothetical protein